MPSSRTWYLGFLFARPDANQGAWPPTLPASAPGWAPRRMQDASMGRGPVDRQPRDALGGRGCQQTAMPPHPLAERGGITGTGSDHGWLAPTSPCDRGGVSATPQARSGGPGAIRSRGVALGELEDVLPRCRAKGRRKRPFKIPIHPGAPSCLGVGLSIHSPRGACPTGLWQNSVCNS